LAELESIDLETGDLSEFASTSTNGSNAISASATAALRGSYGILLEFDGSSDECYAVSNTWTPVDEAWAACHFQIPDGFTLPAWGDCRILGVHCAGFGAGGTSYEVSVRNYSGDAAFPTHLRIIGPSIDQTVDVSLTADTEYWLGLHTLSDASVGGLAVELEEVEVFSDFTVNTSVQDDIDSVIVGPIAVTSEPPNAATIWIDSIIVDDADYPSEPAAGGGVVPTGALAGSLVGPLGGPIWR